jgi:hypothetical protein
MSKLALVLFLVMSASAAIAQTDCSVCDEATKLRDALHKVAIGDGQKAEGDALSKAGLTLITAFGENPPKLRQGRKAFEALIALGAYAAPFGKGEYETALAALLVKEPDYRKRYQAVVRKGIRGRNRGATCRMRYLQNNVQVAECKLQEAAKGANEELAGQRCDASYDLSQCLAKK